MSTIAKLQISLQARSHIGTIFFCRSFVVVLFFSFSLATDCLLKVALFGSQLEKYDEAIELFEKIAKESVESPLRRFSARDYLMRAGFCYLASQNLEGCKHALESYQAIDATFATSREGKLLAALAQAVEANDVDKYVTEIQEYDSLSKLDAWKTTILLRTKKLMESEEDVDAT